MLLSSADPRLALVVYWFIAASWKRSKISPFNAWAVSESCIYSNFSCVRGRSNFKQEQKSQTVESQLKSARPLFLERYVLVGDHRIGCEFHLKSVSPKVSGEVICLKVKVLSTSFTESAHFPKPSFSVYSLNCVYLLMTKPSIRITTLGCSQLPRSSWLA